MLKVTLKSSIKSATPMFEMKPYDIGVIVDTCCTGHVVMRTAKTECAEIMDLSDPRPNGCWNGQNTWKVQLLQPGDSVTLTVET
jgi:hypothetical protein